jgi:hypothetical protein
MFHDGFHLWTIGLALTPAFLDQLPLPRCRSYGYALIIRRVCRPLSAADGVDGRRLIEPMVKWDFCCVCLFMKIILNSMLGVRRVVSKSIPRSIRMQTRTHRS